MRVFLDLGQGGIERGVRPLVGLGYEDMPPLIGRFSLKAKIRQPHS